MVATPGDSHTGRAQPLWPHTWGATGWQQGFAERCWSLVGLEPGGAGVGLPSDLRHIAISPWISQPCLLPTSFPGCVPPCLAPAMAGLELL